MKNNILIDATGGKNWIGGLYYKKNILYSLLNNNNICEKFGFILVTEPENASVFSVFSDKVKIISLSGNRKKLRKVKILLICLLNRCRYIFPNGSNVFFRCGIIPIRWIPDFQHNYFPDFFPEEDIKIRNADYNIVAKNKIPLVLSSYTALEDFQKFYFPQDKIIEVVHFVSYIEQEIRSITPEIEKQVLEKFCLYNRKYTCVMNQFWQHKNHIIILKALKKFYYDYPDSDFLCVFTGAPNDYRNLEYIKKINAMLDEKEIKNHSRMLGFIERTEQLIIMKNAEYIIQPSLFEGWGTVVEDAKVLDKTVLLSDIPVHREQKNEKCILFDPYNAEELAKLIARENQKVHISSTEKGIIDMHKRAKEYSKGFEQLLKELERK